MIKIGMATLASALTLMVAAGGAVAAGDPAAGEKVFAQCKICHSIDKGKNAIGPSLNGVVGRKAGSIEGFKYSEANSKSGVMWTPENLAKYLKSPKDFMPGNKMTFAGLKKDEDIDNVIAYLQEKAK
jgi:cytochrome c